VRTYRTTWIHGQPYNELVQVDGKNLDSKQKKEESKRKADFVTSISRKAKAKGIQQELKSVQWWDVHTKYDFEILPPEPGSHYVLGFQPKQEDLEESSRVERILNHLTGKIWIDDEFNVIRAEATIVAPVKFAWGLAKLDEMQAEYVQQKYATFYVPASLPVNFKAHAGIFRSLHQDVFATWYDIYTRHAGAQDTR
jgi:hypothetical protein